MDEFGPKLAELVELMIETQELVLTFDGDGRRLVEWPRYGHGIRCWSHARLSAEAVAGDLGARREVMTELHRRALACVDIARDLVRDVSRELRKSWLANPEVGAEVKWAIGEAYRVHHCAMEA